MSMMVRTTFAACLASAASLAAAAPLHAQICSNTCTTMVPAAADGVRPRFDGTADAALWPATGEMRVVRIAAVNARNIPCDITVEAVRQDEDPGTDRSGAPQVDASACNNEGDTSSVALRSERSASGNGRLYGISFRMEDPECRDSVVADHVLIAVPRAFEEIPDSLTPDADVAALAFESAGDLACNAESGSDRLALRRR